MCAVQSEENIDVAEDAMCMLTTRAHACVRAQLMPLRGCVVRADLVYEDRGEGAMDAIHCDANADAGCGR